MSLPQHILDTIQDVVDQWVTQARMFTAFEISLAVKDRGVQERHRNMKEDVHEIIIDTAIEDGNYTRTLMDVGAPVQAWLYHPISENPYLYQPLDRGGQNDSTPTPQTTPTSTTPTVSGSAPSCAPSGLRRPRRLTRGANYASSIPPGAYGTDQRGRLCLPVGVLLQIGATPGAQIDVLADEENEQLVITKNDPNHYTTSDTTYTVEPDGNVRITQGTLEKAGLDGLQSYHVESRNAVITVRSFN